MDKDQLYHHIERDLEGGAQPEDINALHDWYQSASDKEVHWEENDGSGLNQVKTDIWNNIKAARMPRRRYPVSILRWAAVLAGLFAGTTYVYRHHSSNRNHESSLSITCPPGQVKKLVLSDGTQVWLNGSSTLSFDTTVYNSVGRELSLSGEAFFDVAPSAGRPFIVNTKHIHIRVLGTAFNVRDRPGGSDAEASLIRGKIELQLTVANPDKKIMLRPGEKFAWTANGLSGPNDANDAVLKEAVAKVDKIVPLRVGERTYLSDTAWKQGEVVFQNLEFKNIARDLEQKYGISIRIDNPLVAEYRYTGVVREETIGQVLEALSLIRPFKYTLSVNNVEIH